MVTGTGLQKGPPSAMRAVWEPKSECCDGREQQGQAGHSGGHTMSPCRPARRRWLCDGSCRRAAEKAQRNPADEPLRLVKSWVK